MVDIETLGVESGCGVWQVGAVTSDGEEFLDTCNPDSAEGDRDIETIKWQATYNSNNWNNALRLSLLGPLDETPAVKFLAWAKNKEYKAKQERKEIWWWSKGNFDFPILTAGIDKGFIPWQYYQIRELRTLMKVTGIYGSKPVAHNALQDAIDQMEILQKILAKIHGEKT